MDLTDEQWAVIEPLLRQLPGRADGRGRPWRSSREVLNGILWILRTGSPWKDLPKIYPPYQTCRRRFQRWVSDGTLELVFCALAEDLGETDDDRELREEFSAKLRVSLEAVANGGATRSAEEVAQRLGLSW